MFVRADLDGATRRTHAYAAILITSIANEQHVADQLCKDSRRNFSFMLNQPVPILIETFEQRRLIRLNPIAVAHIQRFQPAVNVIEQRPARFVFVRDVPEQ